MMADDGRPVPWRRDPPAYWSDADQEPGQMIGAFRGWGLVGGSDISNWWVVMELYDAGLSVRAGWFRRSGALWGSFRWADLRSVWLSPDIVMWRDYVGDKWAFRAAWEEDKQVISSTIRVKEVPFEWHDKIGWLDIAF